MVKSKRQFILRGVMGATLFITACNLFNPAGTGELPDTPEGKLSVGQTRLKNKEFDEAMKAFAASIKDDSTNTLAYFSYAKAARFKYKFNGLELSKEVTDTAGGKIPFLNIPDDRATQYLQSTTRIKPILSIMAKRDSLTRWWSYLKDPLKAREKDPKNAVNRMKFMKKYLESGNAGTPGYYKESDFPLSDQVINFEKIMPDLTLILLVHTFMNLKDLNGDTVINDDDNPKLISDIMSALDSGNTEENLNRIISDIMTDTAKRDSQIADFNNALDKFSESSEDLSDILGTVESMGLEAPGGKEQCDTASGKNCESSANELTSEISSTLDSLGESSKFWRLADKIDNDGDGCVDEEIWDSKDNDGDGIVDEDLRLSPYDTLGIKTPINALKDPSATFNPLSDDPTIELDNNGRMTFTYTVNLNDTISIWSKGLSHENRFKVIDAMGSGPPPYNLSRSDLKFAKDSIGGCWSYLYK